MVGLSILILSGWAGQAALGQFGFAAIGAWAGAASGLPFPLALVAGGLAGAAASVVIGIPGLRLKGLSLAVCTMAFSVSAYTLFMTDNYFGRYLPSSLAPPAIFGLHMSSPVTYYFFCLAILVLCVAALVGLRRSRTARVLIALRSNEPAAQSFGISPQRARLTAYAVSGLLSGVAGVLLAYRLGAVAPATFAPSQSIYLFVFTAIGGLGAISGPAHRACPRLDLGHVFEQPAHHILRNRHRAPGPPLCPSGRVGARVLRPARCHVAPTCHPAADCRAVAPSGARA